METTETDSTFHDVVSANAGRFAVGGGVLTARRPEG